MEAPRQRRKFRLKGWNLGARDLVKTALKAQMKAQPSAFISPVKIYSFLGRILGNSSKRSMPEAEFILFSLDLIPLISVV
jgi:hypothetical protein